MQGGGRHVDIYILGGRHFDFAPLTVAIITPHVVVSTHIAEWQVRPVEIRYLFHI